MLNKLLKEIWLSLAFPVGRPRTEEHGRENTHALRNSSSIITRLLAEMWELQVLLAKAQWGMGSMYLETWREGILVLLSQKDWQNYILESCGKQNFQAINLVLKIYYQLKSRGSLDGIGKAWYRANTELEDLLLTPRKARRSK